jgi:uncharacterized protein (TIGR02246 family)
MTTALATPPVPADETAVRGLFQRLLDAWGRGDGSAYGALFTDDADYVAFDGSRAVGRQAIAESHQRLFDTWLKGTQLTGRIEAVRPLCPDVALVHATGGTIFAGESAPRPLEGLHPDPRSGQARRRMALHRLSQQPDPAAHQAAMDALRHRHEAVPPVVPATKRRTTRCHPHPRGPARRW